MTESAISSPEKVADSEIPGPEQVTHVTLTFDHQLAEAEIEELKSKTAAREVRNVVAFTTVNVGGGTWEYGIDYNNNLNYSRYFQPKNRHRASVSNPQYGVVRSDCTEPGRWASAVEEYDSTNGESKAYWDNEC
jgi:lactococcin 972 family bacteriocin